MTSQDTTTSSSDAKCADAAPVHHRMSTMTVIREDYRKYTVWSYAEFADLAGVSVGTVCKWVSAKSRNGRKITPLPVLNRRGPFRLDALICLKYLRKEI